MLFQTRRLPRLEPVWAYKPRQTTVSLTNRWLHARPHLILPLSCWGVGPGWVCSGVDPIKTNAPHQLLGGKVLLLSLTWPIRTRHMCSWSCTVHTRAFSLAQHKRATTARWQIKYTLCW